MKKEQYHEIDRRISSWMERWGHMAHRISLALVFLWFGSLKLFGYKSASSLIAHTIYVSTPDVMIPLIGIWELSIGFLLLFHSYVRVALLLLFLRLPGTLLALILKAEVCFIVIPWIPSPEGQYLIKDFMLFAAAMVIGGTVREEQQKEGIKH